MIGGRHKYPVNAVDPSVLGRHVVLGYLSAVHMESVERRIGVKKFVIRGSIQIQFIKEFGGIYRYEFCFMIHSKFPSKCIIFYGFRWNIPCGLLERKRGVIDLHILYIQSVKEHIL